MPKVPDFGLSCGTCPRADGPAGDASDASWIRQVLGRFWDEEDGGSPALLSGRESCLHLVTLPGNTGGFSED